MPRAHHRIAEALLIQRGTAEQADKERGGFVRRRAHVLRKHVADGRLLQLQIKIFQHARDIFLAHCRKNLAAGGNDLLGIDRRDKHRIQLLKCADTVHRRQ
jgi:hypothetical protein